MAKGALDPDRRRNGERTGNRRRGAGTRRIVGGSKGIDCKIETASERDRALGGDQVHFGLLVGNIRDDALGVMDRGGGIGKGLQGVGKLVEGCSFRGANVHFHITLGEEHHSIDSLNEVRNVDEVASVHSVHREIDRMSSESGVDKVGDHAFGLARTIDSCGANDGVGFHH